MTVHINGIESAINLSGCSTMGEVLGLIEQNCEDNGSTIISIKIDGAFLEAEELDSLFSKKPDQITRVELGTASGTDITGMLRRTGEELVSAGATLEELPVMLQTGKDQTAIEHIKDLAGLLQRLTQLIPLAGILEESIGKIEVDGIAFKDFPQILSPLLGQMVSALENRDTILAGDLAEYEIAPRLISLGSVLQNL